MCTITLHIWQKEMGVFFGGPGMVFFFSVSIYHLRIQQGNHESWDMGMRVALSVPFRALREAIRKPRIWGVLSSQTNTHIQTGLTSCRCSCCLQREGYLLRPQMLEIRSGFGNELSPLNENHWVSLFFVWQGQIPLGVPPPFFPGTLLSRKPPETQSKRLVLEKNDS